MAHNCKVYIAGPMTGIEAFNYPAFDAEARRLRGLGYEVVSPAELGLDQSCPWEECMRAALRAMLECDCVVMLPGSRASHGAMMEMRVALMVGIPVGASWMLQ